MSLTGTDIAMRVAERTGVELGVVKIVMSAMLEEITETLAKGVDVTVWRFGTFVARQRRAGRRPGPSGSMVEVPERMTVGLRPSRQMKERLNEEAS